MRSALGQRPARLMAVVVVTAVVATGCFSAHGSGAPGGVHGELVQHANSARSQHGVAPLSWNSQLAGLAQQWANHMAATGQFAHRNLSATLNSPGYGAFHRLGENILVGSCGMSSAQIHQAWMNSSSHRANILSGNFNVVGIGSVCANGKVWVVQNFGLL